MKIEMSEYEAELLTNALREVYKDNGVSFWELKGLDGEVLAFKITKWSHFNLARRVDGVILVSQSFLCWYFSHLINEQLQVGA